MGEETIVNSSELLDSELCGSFSIYDRLIESLSDIYDMGTLIEKMKISVVDVCEQLKIKQLSCGIVLSDSAILTANCNSEFTIYETEGPEYDAIMRQHETPAGELIQCSVSFLNYNPSDSQIARAKVLTEIINLCVGRARVGTNLSDTINKDVITGMPNTKAFFDFGNKLFEEYRIADYCVILLNICNFKYVNQIVPFNIGTIVLVRYAHRLLSFIQGDELVTRAGGDSFNILIKKENVNAFLENVKAIPIEVKDGNMRIKFELTCYAGICSIETRMSIQTALEKASNAMTAAKKSSHTPMLYYTEEIGEAQHHANEVRAQFQKALENHEFIAYYQPKVNLRTQRIIGMEALARWNTGDAILGPASFVPILEESRYITELDHYMLRSVCRDIRRWENMELDVPRISVNLSKRNLQNPDIADEIAAILDEYQIDHGSVEIEVTETVDDAGFKSLVRFIGKMKEHGIKVSIDDFGTGYSSLNVLRMMNADVLKIDRSFVNLEKFTEHDEIMVKSIVNLAEAYNMEVITEGIETEEQIKFLMKVGCENVQGYFFDKPLSKEKVTERIRIGCYDKKYNLE